MEPLPTVDEIAAWMAVPVNALAMASKMADDVYAVQQSLRGAFTTAPVSIYKHSTDDVLALYDETGHATDRDLAIVKHAICDKVSADLYLTNDTFSPVWVKIAYAPIVRGAGVIGNFFKGTYPGGIPNSPAPVQSMLTSGLLGAGLGYGAGALGESMLPRTWERGKLKRSLAMLGGMAGVAPGLAWGGMNKSMGLPFNDNSLLNPNPDGSPSTTWHQPATEALGSVKLGSRYKEACARVAKLWDVSGWLKEGDDDSFAMPPESAGGHPELAVNVDAMGRTLWDTGASPHIAGMTMGALAAAQQMPGGEKPGWVTPVQMANLAAHMGAGYVSGALVGSALGVLTGMPEATQEKLRQTGMYVSLLETIVPKIFGF